MRSLGGRLESDLRRTELLDRSTKPPRRPNGFDQRSLGQGMREPDAQESVQGARGDLAQQPKSAPVVDEAGTQPREN